MSHSAKSRLLTKEVAVKSLIFIFALMAILPLKSFAAKTIECTVTASKLVAPSTQADALCGAYQKYVLTELADPKRGDYTNAKVDIYHTDGSVGYCEGGSLMQNGAGLNFATKKADVRLFIPNDGSPATGYVEGNGFFIQYCQLTLNCR